MSPPHPYHRRVCDICSGYLNVGPIRTRDCGGTCLGCMAAEGEDPECIAALLASEDVHDRAIALGVERVKAVRQQALEVAP
jgi:hypothetical protein